MIFKWQAFLLVYLTLLCSVMQLIRAEKQASYLAGRASVYAELDANAALQDNCYAKNGVCK